MLALDLFDHCPFQPLPDWAIAPAAVHDAVALHRRALWGFSLGMENIVSLMLIKQIFFTHQTALETSVRARHKCAQVNLRSPSTARNIASSRSHIRSSNWL